MATIKFRDIEVEYNENILRSWKFQRMFASLEGPAQVFAAADAILDGKADDVAEQLGDDIETMGELLSAITAEIQGEAKN